MQTACHSNIQKTYTPIEVFSKAKYNLAMLQWISWWNLIFWILPLASLLLLLQSRKEQLKRRQEASLKQGDLFPDGASLDSSCEPDYDLLYPVDDEEPPHHKSSLELFLHFLSRGIFSPPLTLFLFSSLWGIFGLWTNHLLSKRVGLPIVYVWISILSATVLSIAVCLLFTKIWTFWKENRDRKDQLIGCEGEAMYRVTLENGIAEVYDEAGRLHRVRCRIEAQGNYIPEGDHLLIVGYDREEDTYLVKRNQPQHHEPRWSS